MYSLNLVNMDKNVLLKYKSGLCQQIVNCPIVDSEEFFNFALFVVEHNSRQFTEFLFTFLVLLHWAIHKREMRIYQARNCIYG